MRQVSYTYRTPFHVWRVVADDKGYTIQFRNKKRWYERALWCWLDRHRNLNWDDANDVLHEELNKERAQAL